MTQNNVQLCRKTLTYLMTYDIIQNALKSVGQLNNLKQVDTAIVVANKVSEAAEKSKKGV